MANIPANGATRRCGEIEGFGERYEADARRDQSLKGRNQVGICGASCERDDDELVDETQLVFP